MATAELLYVLMVHPKGMNHKTVDAYGRRLQVLINGLMIGANDNRVPIVIAARDDYKDRYPRYRNWDRWMADVIRSYNIFVSITPTLGNASQQMLHLAHHHKKKVRYFDGVNLHKVMGIDVLNEKDWKEGWALLFEQ